MTNIAIIVVVYLIIISITAIILTVRDKKAAQSKSRRISEKSLLFVSAIGGSAAMLATMRAIRHKTQHKRFMIGIPAIIILQIAIAVIIFIHPFFLMNPTETGSIPETNVFAVKDGMNSVYLVESESGYILFDAGTNAKNIESVLSENDINADDVRQIFLTHSDSDHAGALSLFPNAEIYINEDEIPLIDGTVKRNLFGGNNISVDIDDIIRVHDGQTLSIDGIEILCIAAPGHTIGSMSYLVGGRYLFTGDAFTYRNGKLGIHPFTMDKPQSRETIEMLIGIVQNSEIIVFTSHYGYFTREDLR